MWWQNLLWGFWNGVTAWAVFVAHIFGRWQEYPVYDSRRSGIWYDLGFLIGASSSMMRPSPRNKDKRKGKAGKEEEKQPEAAEVGLPV